MATIALWSALLLPVLLTPAVDAAGTAAPRWVRPRTSELAFAKAYGDHMVLASAPNKSSVWGYGPPGTTVTVSASDAADGREVAAAQVPVSADGTWKVLLAPVPASSTAHTISASLTAASQISISLHDVLFGAVWVCGGQVLALHLLLATLPTRVD